MCDLLTLAQAISMMAMVTLGQPQSIYVQNNASAPCYLGEPLTYPGTQQPFDCVRQRTGYTSPSNCPDEAGYECRGTGGYFEMPPFRCCLKDPQCPSGEERTNEWQASFRSPPLEFCGSAPFYQCPFLSRCRKSTVGPHLICCKPFDHLLSPFQRQQLQSIRAQQRMDLQPSAAEKQLSDQRWREMFQAQFAPRAVQSSAGYSALPFNGGYKRKRRVSSQF